MNHSGHSVCVKAMRAEEMKGRAAIIAYAVLIPFITTAVLFLAHLAVSWLTQRWLSSDVEALLMFLVFVAMSFASFSWARENW